MTEPAFVDLPDLASDTIGGAAIACNDEFFAERENLLKPDAAVWKEHVYTDRGKWMDGWETRRRREPGHDWCIVRLGMPGIIRGIVVDTAFFRGNFPESCALYGAELDDALDLGAIDTATWTELVPRLPLRGDTRNVFPVAIDRRFTHVRLDIFPDGGVARLRVHGEVAPRWAKLRALGGPIDLAALEHGAVVETCSDMFFGSRNNLIKPGPSRSMADGWETRRRRGPGNDWAIIRLAGTGTIERIELDTTHFKGNAPGRCTLEGGPPDHWRILLASPLQPHTRHRFDDELRRIGPVTHLRLSVFPDGGVARLRAWGTPTHERHAGLAALAAMSTETAAAALRRCCGSERWALEMAAAHPFEDVAALLRTAERVWWALAPADHLEAFSAHPRIGDAKPATAWASDEQQGAAAAQAQTLADLAAANREYFDRFGFIFIICAAGKSADSMLAELDARIGNTHAEETRTAAEEQAKITRLRLHKLIGELA
jgi:allantoicase